MKPRSSQRSRTVLVITEIQSSEVREVVEVAIPSWRGAVLLNG